MQREMGPTGHGGGSVGQGPAENWLPKCPPIALYIYLKPDVVLRRLWLWSWLCHHVSPRPPPGASESDAHTTKRPSTTTSRQLYRPRPTPPSPLPKSPEGGGAALPAPLLSLACEKLPEPSTSAGKRAPLSCGTSAQSLRQPEACVARC